MSRLQEARELLAATEGHTPGPWTGKMWSGDKSSAIEAHGGDLYEPVAEIPHDDMGETQEPEVAANFKLIAAAPALRDLLAALAAELDCIAKLRADLARVIAERNDLKAMCVGYREDIAKHAASIFGRENDRLQAENKRVTAERDGWEEIARTLGEQSTSRLAGKLEAEAENARLRAALELALRNGIRKNEVTTCEAIRAALRGEVTSA